jgi:hypothetical protein
LGRNSYPDIPDFTAASWQSRRSDAQLLSSILEGKSDDMPAFERKIKKQQARDLVAHIRTFAPAKEKSKKEKQESRDSSEFETQFRALEQELDLLQRQFRELSQSQDATPSKEVGPSPK